MKTIWSILKWLLIAWGLVCALGAIVLGGLFVYHTTIGNRAVSGKAEKEDVRFVLNWCSLGDERIEEVLNSHQSARSFTGDHIDAYSIRISHVSLDELQTDKWQRADKATGVYKDAIDFMPGWLHYVPWFPTMDEIRSDHYYIYLWGIAFHGSSPDSASVILVRPEDNMVFYFDASM
jgi:hypothetical protein